MATRSQTALISGTLQVKHEAQVAAAAVGKADSPKSGVSVPPSAASPNLRPVLGLMSASTALLTALAMMGMLENVVKISAPVRRREGWDIVVSTQKRAGIAFV